MPYGTLTEPMLDAIEPYIRGRIVHDLGAGDCILALVLLNHGAAGVEAVDQRDLGPSQWPPGGRYHRSRLCSYCPEAIDVAFVSWPENTEHKTDELLPLIRRAKTVIYLGKNTGGTQCGTPALFQHFARRKLLIYEPHRFNVLCIYGHLLGRKRPKAKLRQEEIAGLMVGEQLVEYSDT